MKRLFALLLLLVPCSGCMLFEDEYYYDSSYPAFSQPSSSCAAPTGLVNVSQTIEPPR